MYKVVLVDDEQVILSGLSRVIRWDEFGCTVVGTASDGREGLDLIRRLRPDVVFTDIRMPNMDGLTMLAALRSEFPHMQVAVLTAFRDFDYAQRAINLGVCRYLLKPSRMSELTEAIRTMTERLDAMGRARESSAAPEPPDGGEAGNFIVQAALSYMQSHCTERISLSDVAEQVYVSQWHLSKLINRHSNQSFFDILGGMRIEKAKELLCNPAMRINDIAERVGYSDVAHFSKSFKKITGTTPSEYRAQLGRSKQT